MALINDLHVCISFIFLFSFKSSSSLSSLCSLIMRFLGGASWSTPCFHCFNQRFEMHVTLHTSHVTSHKSHVTHLTSHVTRHTSHVTRHTSHVTPHTSLVSSGLEQQRISQARYGQKSQNQHGGIQSTSEGRLHCHSHFPAIFLP